MIVVPGRLHLPKPYRCGSPPGEFALKTNIGIKTWKIFIIQKKEENLKWKEFGFIMHQGKRLRLKLEKIFQLNVKHPREFVFYVRKQ
jgi:hypothetical protein